MSGLDEKGVEVAARAMCHRPDECVFGTGSASGDGSSSFECYRYAWQDKVGEARTAIRAYLSVAGPKAGTVEVTHRHKKRGSEYALLGIGKMQAEHWYLPGAMEAGPSVDMSEVAIYRGTDDTLWVRPREEFEDGRFEALVPSPSVAEAFPQPDRNRSGKPPCAECHLQFGDTCDICGASHPAPSPTVPDGLDALVERLRGVPPKWVDLRLGNEAADAIAALKAERDEALREIAFLKAANESLSRENALNQRMFHEASKSAETAERDTAAEAHAFKNFHRSLCERFDYTHDEKDWRPDQVSLIEGIASKLSAALARNAEIEAENTILRQHVGEIHNRVRHTLSAEIEAASDKAFKAMAATSPLAAIRASARSTLEGK